MHLHGGWVAFAIFVFLIVIFIILQNGIKNKKTQPILNEPNKSGLNDAFRPNLPRGYALPRKNITNITNK